MRRRDAEPKIIMNAVQAFVYHVADIESGKYPIRRTTIHGSNIPSQPSIARNLKVFILMVITSLQKISSYRPNR